MKTLLTSSILAVVLLGVLLAAGAAPAPGAAAAAAPTATPRPCTNAAQFMTDVTIPDNTILPPGKAFTKTWRLKNTGTCTWSTGYKLVRVSGATLGGPASVRLPRAAARNGTVDISTSLVAPTAPGSYTGYWQLANASGARFGPKIRVVIIVPNPAAGESLPDTLTFWGGAGGGTTKDTCAGLFPEAAGQPVTVAPISHREQGTRLCIYSLPAYSTATVTLTSPAGTRYTAQYDVGGAVPSDIEGSDPVTVVGIPLMWPATAPEGAWKLSVQGANFRRDVTFTVSAQRHAEEMELRASPLDSFLPFDTLDDGPLGYVLSYPAGERIQFSGASYPANARIPLGIYRDDAGDFRLVHSELITTDAAGRFKTTYRIPGTLAAGRYAAAAGKPDFWTRLDNGVYDIIGRAGTAYFYVRGGVDDPEPYLATWTYQPEGEPLQVTLRGINLGRATTRGASLTVSSPDAARLEIASADVPILPATWTDCAVATPHAWVLTATTPCHTALQHNTACRRSVNLTYPLAEALYKPWATGETQELTVRVWPLPGKQEVRIYARMAMLAGPSGCNLALAPSAGEADGTDQQGFPVYVITVPAP